VRYRSNAPAASERFYKNVGRKVADNLITVKREESMKVIVKKSEIETDASVALVKAFRIANKRAGEQKRLMNNETLDEGAREEARTQFMTHCAKLRDLAEKAETLNFHIWVNEDGTTGHTNDKDYKVTPDESNDYEAFAERMAEITARIEAMAFNPVNIPVHLN
jgi:lauroyl/myristoyl acyltransferase